jgi:sigma-B regulation protein RsbU (phosphoserine phosphatase)
LRIGRDIQNSVLPRTFPAFPHRKEFDIFALMEAAKEVGGDFYDFFFINEKKLCFIIGDVSGKGVPAALFMMITKTLLKTIALRDLSPEEILFNVNKIVASQNERSMFVTVQCAILDTETGELKIGNAGHNPPLIGKGNGQGYEFITLPESIVLGPMEDVTFSSVTVMLKPADIIFLYTDGITEAMNPQSEIFSDDRLKTTLSSLTGSNVTDIVCGVRDEIKKYAREAPQSDDITIVALQYKGGSF